VLLLFKSYTTGANQSVFGGCGFGKLFPKTLQDTNSLSIYRTNVSVSKSKQLGFAITASLISSLSSGEFVEVIADNPISRSS
jgi:hypothetical protein